MPTQKIAAARAIAKALRPSEDTIDTSIVRAANLIATIAGARLESGVAAEVGHEAFMHASASLHALSDARDHVIACHRELAGTRDMQGIDPGEAGCTLKVAGRRLDLVHARAA